jgi:hypothetical protein
VADQDLAARLSGADKPIGTGDALRALAITQIA